MTKKIIVTGGLGYIGSHITVELIKLGWMVLIIDNKTNSGDKVEKQIRSNLTINELNLLRVFDCDINNSEFIYGILDVYENISHVIHIAALKSVNESCHNPEKYYSVNVSGTLNILKCMKKYGINNLIFAGSASVYGQCSKGNRSSITENYDFEPTNPYARSKVMCEQILEDFCKANEKFKCVVLRYFNPAGASFKYRLGEDSPNPQNVIPILTQKIVKKQKFVVFGTDYDTKDGTCVRDYIHIQDLVDAHVQTIKKLDLFKQFSTLNIGSGVGTSIKELIYAMTSANDVFFDIDSENKREGDVPVLVSNIEKAYKMIQFECKYNIKDICKSAYEWESLKH